MGCSRSYLVVINHASCDTLLTPVDVQIFLGDVALIPADPSGFFDLNPEVGKGPVALLLAETIVAGIAGGMKSPTLGGRRIFEDGSQRDGDRLVVVDFHRKKLLGGFWEHGSGIFDFQREAQQEDGEENAGGGG